MSRQDLVTHLLAENAVIARTCPGYCMLSNCIPASHLSHCQLLKRGNDWLAILSSVSAVQRLPQQAAMFWAAVGNFTSHANINQSINIFNVLGGNWDPTDKKCSSVNSYRQDLLPTCKAFPKETATCIWFTQNHKVCNSTTVLQDVQML